MRYLYGIGFNEFRTVVLLYLQIKKGLQISRLPNFQIFKLSNYQIYLSAYGLLNQKPVMHGNGTIAHACQVIVMGYYYECLVVLAAKGEKKLVQFFLVV